MLKNTQNSKKKKLVIVSAILLALTLLTTGLISAFYSDIFGTQSGATTGTLNIGGTYTYTVNGQTVQPDAINNLNPGDVIVVNAALTNDGNKSAWIRSVISLTNAAAELLPFISVYSGTVTQAEIIGGTDLTGRIITLNNGIAASTVSVIDGSGAYAETETSAGGGDTNDYLLSSNYNFSFTIYFSTAADNSTQNKTFDISVYAQALQFRNNNLTAPDEAAWATVQAI